MLIFFNFKFVKKPIFLKIFLNLPIGPSDPLPAGGGLFEQGGPYMRIGTIASLPNAYSQFGQIKDEYGRGYTIERGDIPENAERGDEYAYKVEIWANGSGLAYDLDED